MSIAIVFLMVWPISQLMPLPAVCMMVRTMIRVVSEPIARPILRSVLKEIKKVMFQVILMLGVIVMI